MGSLELVQPARATGRHRSPRPPAPPGGHAQRGAIGHVKLAEVAQRGAQPGRPERRGELVVAVAVADQQSERHAVGEASRILLGEERQSRRAERGEGAKPRIARS